MKYKENSSGILELIRQYDSVSIIGMSKNVGKTTTLNQIIREAHGKFKLGITSIGRDGEELDLVTATAKPKIYIESGTVVATAKQCLLNSDITREILKTTGFNTPLGEIIICKALSDGYIDLSGPSVNSYMKEITKQLKKFGSDIVIIDGALSRKTFASPSITDATVLSTGAALSNNMNKVIEETSYAVKILSLESENDKKIISIAKKILLLANVGIIYKDNSYKVLDIATALASSKDIICCINCNVSHIIIKGVLSDKLLRDIMSVSNEYKDIVFLVEDGTKVFVQKDTLYRFQKQGGIIRVIAGINVVCVTANPNSPYGYEYDKVKFIECLRSSIDIPVFDVVGGD